jgi:hypothetical protein
MPTGESMNKIMILFVSFVTIIFLPCVVFAESVDKHLNKSPAIIVSAETYDETKMTLEEISRNFNLVVNEGTAGRIKDGLLVGLQSPKSVYTSREEVLLYLRSMPVDRTKKMIIHADGRFNLKVLDLESGSVISGDFSRPTFFGSSGSSEHEPPFFSVGDSDDSCPEVVWFFTKGF